MNTSRILRAAVGGGNFAKTAAITQWDYGYILLIEGTELPATYRVDFSNDREHGEALPVYGDENGVEVPEELIATGKDIFAFYYYVSENFGKTAHTWQIPNHLRAKAGDREPTPSQQDSIDQLIVRSNAAVAGAEQSASDAAESAQSAAQSAAESAGSATSAAQSASQASASATSAAQSAQQASASASTASAAATSASASAQNASRDADRAEQAAAQSGYMHFYINDEGDLIYQRTSNVNVDFYLDNDGDLHVRANG